MGHSTVLTFLFAKVSSRTDILGSRCSVVGIAIHYGLNGLGFELRRGREFP